MRLLAVLGILLAIALPVALSIFLARHQSMDQEQQRAIGYAREVLDRSETTADEIEAAFRALAASRSLDPCSEANIDLMRKLDVSSPSIQAIGVVNGDTLLCSSLTSPAEPVFIGAPDVRQPGGLAVWTDAELPFARGVHFLVVARAPYAAIIHKGLPIAVSNAGQGMSVALLSERGEILTARGYIDAAWFGRLDGSLQASFRNGGYVVAVVKSSRYFVDAVAALPVSELNERTWAIARTVVPFGIAMGLLLAWAAVALARSQLAMPAVLKAALRRKELFMVYQPVVDLHTGRWVGAEALIRWHRPKGEAVRPDVFIVAAEDSGLIRQVTKDVVLEQVRTDAAVLFREFPDFHIAINLAADDLQSEATIAMLRQLVDATGARSGSLMVEATERSFAEPRTVRGIVDALRAAGIRIAIDDFGTGYSSLSFLESLQFDLLKIDKSFVDTLDTGAPTSQVIHHIIEMAKALKLEMIAEGVETEAQAAFLRARGVHYAQGWLFAQPMSFKHLLEALHGELDVTQDEPETG
ncbi:EAL domain-containing protein [Massilia solisilvae]|uniref:cyclic-guanylate-specific phosphodiesterase n=1 Tax=Massilia solisilvae TaxID=1811225 RepID=A0ABT2BR90_9BURK|nr:EAL domain-containing protein [Massilia solisilvae]MCS0611033.1 EAL domain-containing protein [Massilia solisilvae]